MKHAILGLLARGLSERRIARVRRGGSVDVDEVFVLLDGVARQS